MITYNPATYIDSQTLLISGESDVTPPVPFRIYVDGDLVASYDSEVAIFERIVSVQPGDSVNIEVLDEAGVLPSPAFPSRASLNWTAVPDGARYIIEEYVDSSWETVANLKANGRTAFTWLSRRLESDQQHQFRITARDSVNNDATATTVSFFIVRIPDAPATTMEYNSIDGTVTIAEA